MEKGQKAFVIVVLFNPLVEQVENKIKSIKCNTIFVDNSPEPKPQIRDLLAGRENITYLPLYKNMGIARAQNIGIHEAMKKGANFFIFFDQDSIPDETFVNGMINEYINLTKLGYKIGVLGPIVKRYDQTEFKSNFHTEKDFDKNGFRETNYVISSGSIVNRSYIETVGGLDNTLFIDMVDTEWCKRGRKYGYLSGQTNKYSMSHKVGRGEFKIFKYQSKISSPFRYFYQWRNQIWLSRRDYIESSFTPYLHLLIQTALYPLFLKDGGSIIYNSWKGFFYGLFHKNEPDFTYNKEC